MWNLLCSSNPLSKNIVIDRCVAVYCIVPLHNAFEHPHIPIHPFIRLAEAVWMLKNHRGLR